MGEVASACLSRKAGPSMAPGSRATEVFHGGRRKARLLVAARPGHEMAWPPCDRGRRSVAGMPVSCRPSRGGLGWDWAFRKDIHECQTQAPIAHSILLE